MQRGRSIRQEHEVGCDRLHTKRSRLSEERNECDRLRPGELQDAIKGAQDGACHQPLPQQRQRQRLEGTSYQVECNCDGHAALGSFCCCVQQGPVISHTLVSRHPAHSCSSLVDPNETSTVVIATLGTRCHQGAEGVPIYDWTLALYGSLAQLMHAPGVDRQQLGGCFLRGTSLQSLRRLAFVTVGRHTDRCRRRRTLHLQFYVWKGARSGR
jgi:hypothetical protein